MLRRFIPSSSYPCCASSFASTAVTASSSMLFTSNASLFTTSNIDLAAASAASKSKLMKLKSFSNKKSGISSSSSSSSAAKKPKLLAKAVVGGSKITTFPSSKKPAPQNAQTSNNKKEATKPETDETEERGDTKPTLNSEQQAVLGFIKENPKQSIFLTGSGGTGKSVLIRAIADALPPQHTFLAAPTGVAALNIGGTTLHSFLRLQPDGQFDLRSMVGGGVWADVQRRFWQCNTLIIDEISMVDPSVFQAVDRLAQIARNSPQPFGGIQLILCGDFLQLPPVNVNGDGGLNSTSNDAEGEDDEGDDLSVVDGTNKNDNTTKFNARRQFRYVPPNKCNADTTSKYCFQTREWKRLNPKLFNLTQVMRQKEPDLINLLNKIRFGTQSDSQMKKILMSPKDSCIKTDISDVAAPVRIFCRNREVNERNRDCFNALRKNRDLMMRHYDEDLAKTGLVSPHVPQRREVIYTCAMVGDARIFGRVIPKRLPLCVGSRVMLLKNLDVSGGLVNGSTGVVVGFFDSSSACEEIESMAMESGCSLDGASSSGSGNAPLTTLFAGDFGDQLKLNNSSGAASKKNNNKKSAAANSKKKKSDAADDGIEDSMAVSPEDFLLQYRDDPKDKLQNITKGNELFPVVKFNGVSHPVVITPTIWKQRSGGSVSSKLLQLPLRHAWAITSHKAQGMTFEKVHVDLTNAFERGQAYVALSRARTIEHLKVTGYDAKKVQACELAAGFHKEVEQLSKKEFDTLVSSAEGKSIAKK